MSAPSAPIPAPITSWIGIDGVALVIGAGQGIGKTTALSFASAGASAIVLSGRTVSTLTQTAEEIKQLNLPHPVETLVVTADITNEEQVKNLFAIAQGKFGRIDYVANTAGVRSITSCMLSLIWGY
jgi:meso-butanediol dehydrogenase/(S,S)-butanediol dehydrogenase/diacetyl reductase